MTTLVDDRPIRVPGIPDLAFSVAGAAAVAHAATPTLSLRIGAAADDRFEVRSLMLSTQVRIAVARRPHDAATRERLAELLGGLDGWHAAAASLLWMQTVCLVPPFHGAAEFDLALPCTYDFDVAAAKYLKALGDGAIPLQLLFSGTVFYSEPGGPLRTALIPWDREARFDLPVALWREAMERSFPGTVWIRVESGTWERLRRFKAHRLMSWDEALTALLDTEREGQA